MRMNPLAAVMMRQQIQRTRYESPTRGEDYYEALLHLQLAAWMAALYDEEPDPAVRRTCIQLERRRSATCWFSGKLCSLSGAS